MVILRYLDDWDRTIETLMFESQTDAMNHVIQHAERRYVEPDGRYEYDNFDNGAWSYSIHEHELEPSPEPYTGPWLRVWPDRPMTVESGGTWEVKTQEEVDRIHKINRR